MTRVAVLDDWQGVARGSADWAPLQARAEVFFFAEAFAGEDDAAAALVGFEIVLSMRERTPLPASLIGRLPKLRMLGITGARNASLDLAACTARGIVVCHTTSDGRSDSATAELALGLLIAAARAIPAADAAIRAGGFQAGVPVGTTLAGKTLGVIGLGRLGSLMAGYGRALAMRVLAWSPNLTAEKAAGVGAELVPKAELLQRADAVSLHLVLSPRSRGTLGAADLARMKPGAILINTSRGPLVDEAALIDVLEHKRIAGAALDVYDMEPLPPEHPFRTLPNVVATGHVGFVTRATYDVFYRDTVKNIIAWLDSR
jgi:phosphoglycerate dehydrogenase-like enzyme